MDKPRGIKKRSWHTLRKLTSFGKKDMQSIAQTMQLNRLATDLEIAEQLTASMAQDASGFDSLTIAKNLEFVTTLIRNSRQVYEADLYEEKMDLVAEELEAEARENIQQDLRDLEQEIQ